MAGGAQGAGAPQFKGQNFLNNLQSYGQQGGNLSQLQNSPYAGQLAQQLQNAQSNQQKFRQSQTSGQAQQQPTYGVSTDWAQTLINSQQPAQQQPAMGSLGQPAGGYAQSNYNQSGGQGQLTPAQQAAIAYNANPQQQPAMGSLGQAAQNGTNFNPYGQGPMAQPPGPMAQPMGAMQMDARILDDGTSVGRNDPRFFNPSQGQAAQNWANFSPQSPMGGFPQQPQGAGPDVTGNYPAANMGYDQSGSDAGIGGRAVLGVQSPMGGVTSRAGGPPNFSQMRPQRGGLQVQGNPTMQQFIRGQRMPLYRS